MMSADMRRRPTRRTTPTGQSTSQPPSSPPPELRANETDSDEEPVSPQQSRLSNGDQEEGQSRDHGQVQEQQQVQEPAKSHEAQNQVPRRLLWPSRRALAAVVLAAAALVSAIAVVHVLDWEPFPTTCEPEQRSLEDHIAIIAGLAPRYAEVLLPLAEPALVPTQSPGSQLLRPIDAAARYDNVARELCDHVPVLSPPRSLSSSLLPVARSGEDVAATAQVAEGLCKSYLNATSNIREAMCVVPRELEGGVEWLARFGGYLYGIAARVNKIEWQRRQEDDEHFFAERAGEFEGDAGAAWGRDREYQYNEHVYVAVEGQMTKWIKSHNDIAVWIDDLRQKIGNARAIEEYLLPMFSRELERRKRETSYSNGQATTQPGSDTSRWWGLWGEESRGKTVQEKRDERRLREAEEALELVERVGLPLRRGLHGLVDAVAGGLAGIQNDLVRVDERLRQLHERNWREPAVLVSIATTPPATDTPNFLSLARITSWANAICRLPGGDTVLRLIFGTVHYTFPTGSVILEQLENGATATERRTHQAREQEDGFEEGGGGEVITKIL